MSGLSPAPAEADVSVVVSRWPRLSRHRHALAAGAGLLLFALALWVLHRELVGLHAADIRAAVARLSAWQLLAAVLATAVSYLALTGYDVLALRILSHRLPYRRVALASFMATAVGHNLGFAVVSAGAVRARLYIAWGLSATEVAAMIALVGFTLGVGLAFAGGLALLLEPALASALLRLSPGAVQAIGGLLVLLALAYALAGSVHKAPVVWRHWSLQLPTSGVAWQQLGLAVVDVAAAATVLYLLLGPQPGLSWPVFVGVYVLAVVVGIVSHVPGGLGVFETVMLLALPTVPREVLIAAMVLYRVVYFLLPLGLATLLAAGMALRSRHRRVARRVRGGVRGMRRVLTWAAPTVSSAAVFLTGVVLLFSGSLPAERARLHWLHAILPLPVLEVSHLAGSLVGLGLVILAQGLYRRVDASYRLTAWLLGAGAVLSLLRGLDVEAAVLSLGVLTGLYLSRSAFHRRAAWWSAGASPAALAGLVAVLGATVWLGLFSYQNVAYTDTLWWQFALHGDAPRFLRASLLAAVALLAWMLWRWLQPRRPEPAQPDAAELDRAARLVAASPNADAALALVGDKRLLFDEQDRAFLMYQVRGQSWIAMGDPVGDGQAGAALVWRFRELADQHGGRPVFYQVEAAGIGHYLDLGLGAIKIGEEALVPLAGFSLEGSARADLRHAHRRGQRDGLSVEIVPSLRDQPALLDELAQVSDAWLDDKHTREKGFSVGHFDRDYLARLPCALVRQQGRLIAFANLWVSGAKHEISIDLMLSIDLMRHRSGSSGAVMDFLFVELMLWGAQQGYAQFNLGMAPLSGLETHPLAPLWHRLGTLLYRHGEHFYNFQGLRAYKAKFSPRWQPKYLMAPGGLGLPAVLLDVAALISGGLKGLVWR